MSRYVSLLIVMVTCAWAAPAEAAPGFRGWKFGMSKARVQKVKGCKPYRPVKVTKGLECDNFKWLGAKNKISFVFRDGDMAKTQIWLYMGKDADRAATRLHAGLGYFRGKHGLVESPAGDVPRKLKVLKKVVKDLQKHKRMAKVQFKPRKNPKGYFTFISLVYHPVHGYYVFLYFQPPR